MKSFLTATLVSLLYFSAFAQSDTLSSVAYSKINPNNRFKHDYILVTRRFVELKNHNKVYYSFGLSMGFANLNNLWAYAGHEQVVGGTSVYPKIENVQNKVTSSNNHQLGLDIEIPTKFKSFLVTSGLEFFTTKLRYIDDQFHWFGSNPNSGATVGYSYVPDEEYAKTHDWTRLSLKQYVFINKLSIPLGIKAHSRRWYAHFKISADVLLKASEIQRWGSAKNIFRYIYEDSGMPSTFNEGKLNANFKPVVLASALELGYGNFGVYFKSTFTSFLTEDFYQFKKEVKNYERNRYKNPRLIDFGLKLSI